MFADYAQKYFEKGLSVIPVRGKGITIPDWSKYSTSLPTQQEIDGWASGQWADAGIAIVCGPVSGITVIDADSSEILQKIKNAGITSPIRKFGSKGESLFFKFNGKRSEVYENLDIISEGKYTVIPPSIHPVTNRPYIWSANDLLDFDICDLPKYPHELIDPITKELGGANYSLIKTGRNNKIFSMIKAAIDNGKTPQETIEEVFEYDMRVHKDHENGPYCLDKKELYKGKGKKSIAQFVFTTYANSLKNDQEVNIGISSNEEQQKQIIQLTENSISLNHSIKNKYKKLPKLRGVGALIFDDIYKNSPIPRSQFSSMATISIASACIGNKLFLRGTGANLYLYSVSGSGMGKDFPMRRAQQYLSEIGLGRLFGTSSPTSESVILKILGESRESIFFINEADSFLKRISNDRTNMGVKECLTQLFESSGRHLISKKILKQTSRGTEIEKMGDTFSPYLNLYMSSTIEAFKEHARSGMFSTGFGARFMYFFEDRKKKGRVLRDYSPKCDQAVCDALKMIAKSDKPFGIDLDQKGAFELPNALLNDETNKFLDECIEAIQCEVFNSNGDMGTEITSRKAMAISKLAIIDHAFINPDKYIYTFIEKESVEWAKKYVDAVYNNMMLNLPCYVVNSDYERKYNDMLSYIVKRQEKNIPTTKKDISNRFRYDSMLRSRIMKDIIDSGEIKLQ